MTSKFVKSNTPELLTAFGVTGVVSTAYLTHGAANKARDSLVMAPKDLPRKERLKVIWKHYIPPVISGAVSIGCIIGSNKASANKTAAAVAAYSLTEKAFSDYRGKIVETIGKGKEQKARDEIAQERVSANPPGANVVVVNGGHVLCCDLKMLVYFRSSMEDINQAINKINFRLNQDEDQSLADFYYILGVPESPVSYRMGWNSDKQLAVSFTTALSPSGEPCVAFEYNYLQPLR